MKPTDVKTEIGNRVQLECISVGNPTPTLFWMKEGGSGVLLPGSAQGHVRVSPEGALIIGECFRSFFVNTCTNQQIDQIKL